MIANEGYISLTIMREQQYCELHQQAKLYLRETANSIHMLGIMRPEDLIRRWLISYYAEALYLTDGINTPIRIDPNLVQSVCYHVDLSTPRWAGAKFSAPEISESLSRRFHFCKPLKDEWIDQFNKFAKMGLEIEGEMNQEECAVECENIIFEALEDSGSTRPYLFVEDEFMSVTLDLFDHLMSIENYDIQFTTSKEVLEYANVLRKFDGYFLVTREEKVDSNWGVYCSSIAHKEIEEYRQFSSEDDDKTMSGRPRKQEVAYSIYKTIYPNGHSGVIWQEVEASVSKKMGELVSAQTIKAAIKSTEKTDE